MHVKGRFNSCAQSARLGYSHVFYCENKSKQCCSLAFSSQHATNLPKGLLRTKVAKLLPITPS